MSGKLELYTKPEHQMIFRNERFIEMVLAETDSLKLTVLIDLQRREVDNYKVYRFSAYGYVEVDSCTYIGDAFEKCGVNLTADDDEEPF